MMQRGCDEYASPTKMSFTAYTGKQTLVTIYVIIYPDATSVFQYPSI